MKTTNLSSPHTTTTFSFHLRTTIYQYLNLTALDFPFLCELRLRRQRYRNNKRLELPFSVFGDRVTWSFCEREREMGMARDTDRLKEPRDRLILGCTVSAKELLGIRARKCCFRCVVDGRIRSHVLLRRAASGLYRPFFVLACRSLRGLEYHVTAKNPSSFSLSETLANVCDALTGRRTGRSPASGRLSYARQCTPMQCNAMQYHAT